MSTAGENRGGGRKRGKLGMNMATTFAFDCFANKAKQSLRINQIMHLEK